MEGVDNELDAELVELTSEISLKQKLIEELEMSQKRMEIMKSQYENKLQVCILITPHLKEGKNFNKISIRLLSLFYLLCLIPHN